MVSVFPTPGLEETIRMQGSSTFQVLMQLCKPVEQVLVITTTDPIPKPGPEGVCSKALPAGF